MEQDSLTVEEYQWTQAGYLRVASVKAGQVFRPRVFAGLDINLQALL